MRRALTLSAVLLCVGPAASAAQPNAKPLFASDQTIRIGIRGPISAMARSMGRSREPRSATLTVGGETLPVLLSPRGITRLQHDICQFPPLRVEFASAPPSTSLFSGQTRLKLVTHCRRAPAFQQHVLLEYAAYKLYEALTPASFSVRLATIDYADADGRPLISRVGFFIEEHEDVARRLGMARPPVGDMIATAQLSPRDSARAALFEYMIGNLDWSFRAGPPGEGCCHNSRLVAPAPGATTGFVAVPYDFDFSGLVDAPYATPPPIVNVPSVRTRQYRGHCAHNRELPAVTAEFRAKRPQLAQALAGVPGLEERTRRKAAAYLDSFFADIEPGQKLAEGRPRTCVR